MENSNPSENSNPVYTGNEHLYATDLECREQ